MIESNSSIGPTVDGQPGTAATPSGRWGAMLAGALLVVIGAGMLAERTGLLSLQWRSAIWPVLLMVFGVASLLRPTRDGRQGLFLVIAGLWWYAGLAGWISMLQTWPLLIIGLGAAVVLQAVTAPRQPHRAWTPGTRETGLMPLVLIAILAGALFSSRDRIGSFTASDGGFRVVSIMGATRHVLADEPVTSGTIVTVMGSNALDLRRAAVTPGTSIAIDGITIMGRSVLYVPAGWNVDLNSLSVFGRVDDRRTGRSPTAMPADATSTTPAPDAPRLQLRGALVFGRVDIRSTEDRTEERRR